LFANHNHTDAPVYITNGEDEKNSALGVIFIPFF
jgi:hypothetical protein